MDDTLDPRFYAITYFDETGEPTVTCFVVAFDEFGAADLGWQISPNAVDFEVVESPLPNLPTRKAA
ncbi:MAG: hypothetical protein CMJ42_20205 [Phyllobacteriaceae bacterium]|nr:hypothetical protein [Phyllobacteriaceae bacterium]MBA90264.1 hypothetical protein [Phyllobacteriaceae bacterium]